MTDKEETADRGRPNWLWLGAGAAALAVGVLIFLSAGAAGNAASSDAGETAREERPLVETGLARRAPPTFTVSAPGRIQPRQTLRVVAEVSGKISWLNPELVVGGRIDAGETLFRIESSDYEAELARAEAQRDTAAAQLEQARADRERQLGLAEIGAVPQAAAEAAEAAFETAQASLAQANSAVSIAERRLAKTRVRAPFPAIVTAEDLSLDTYVAPGAELARLIDASAGIIEAGLSPRNVDAVSRMRRTLDGEPVPARAVPNSGSLGNTVLEGYLEAFAPEIDPASRTVSVRAVFPNAFAPEQDGLVFAGDFLTLEVDARAAGEVFEIPAGAIRRDSFVWAVTRDNTLERVAVSPIETHGDMILATSEAPLDGRPLMITPLAEELDGMRVRLADAAGG